VCASIRLELANRSFLINTAEPEKLKDDIQNHIIFSYNIIIKMEIDHNGTAG
jgi:hypothetical protein